MGTAQTSPRDQGVGLTQNSPSSVAQCLSGGRLPSLRERVRLVMEGSHWRTPYEIRAEMGRRWGRSGSDSGVTAKLRDLRKKQFGGRTVQSRRCTRPDAAPGAELWEYRLLPIAMGRAFGPEAPGPTAADCDARILRDMYAIFKGAEVRLELLEAQHVAFGCPRDEVRGRLNALVRAGNLIRLRSGGLNYYRFETKESPTVDPAGPRQDRGCPAVPAPGVGPPTGGAGRADGQRERKGHGRPRDEQMLLLPGTRQLEDAGT